MTDNKSIIERIEKYISFKKISTRKFEMSLGFSNGFFATSKKQNSSLSVDKIVKIIDMYKELSILWILTGEGEMIKNDFLINEPKEHYNVAINNGGNVEQKINLADCEKEVENLRTQIQLLKNTVADKEKIINLLSKNQ